MIPDLAPLLITSDILSEVHTTLAKVYPNEGCGVIVRTPEGAAKVLVSENLTDNMHALDPETYTRSAERGYVLDTRLIVAAERRGETLMVIFHSHPDVGAYFSEEDVQKALVDWGDGPEPAFPGVDYLVTAVNKGKAEESKRFRFDFQKGVFTLIETLCV